MKNYLQRLHNTNPNTNPKKMQQLMCVSFSSINGNSTILPSKNQVENKLRREEEQKKKKKLMMESLASPLMALILTLSSPSFITPVLHEKPAVASQGAKLFQKACIGCHDMGGNILQPGSTLFLEDLKRNGVATEEEIYNITYFGKSRMPGFGEKCTPRGQCTFGPRLHEDEIKMLAEFVKAQAENGWPKIDIMEMDS